MGYRDYSTAKGHIVDVLGHGDFTTIQAAINAASSGQDIFVRSGTYTENLTLKAGVNITSFDCDSSLNGTGNVIISGTIGMTVAGSVTITGIQLQTNGAALLSITGSAASVINIDDCFLNITDSTGIINSSSSASSAINISDTNGNIGTTGITIFNHTGAGQIFLYNTDFQNTGGSSTPSTISDGNFFSRRTYYPIPLTISGTATASSTYSQWDTSAQNATCCTFGGSGPALWLYSQFFAGTASAISVGTTAQLASAVIESSNTNAITGAGTLSYADLIFAGSSNTINTAVQVPFSWKPFATAGNTATAVRGTAAFDSTEFTVTDGLVTIIPGAAGGIQNLDGNTGTATGATVNIVTPASNGDGTPAFTASGATVTLDFSSGTNLGIGLFSLSSSPAGGNNSCYGNRAGQNITAQGRNTAIGSSVLQNVSTGTGSNTSIGTSSLSGLLTGSFNIALGDSAGLNYTGAESSNVIFGNTGTLGESNVIRIGTQGAGAAQQNQCFIAGIVGVTTSNTQFVTINSSTGQLGAVAAIVTTWNDASGSFTATANQGYFLTGASTPTLPASPSQGDMVQFDCDTGSTVTVTANTGQRIRIGSTLSALAGTAASSTQGNSLRLVFRSSTSTWHSIGAPEGTWTVT